jgi:hypothetical protein
VRYSVSDTLSDPLSCPVFHSVRNAVNDAVTETSATVGVTVLVSTQNHIHTHTWNAYEEENAKKNSDQILGFNLPAGSERLCLIARRQRCELKARS